MTHTTPPSAPLTALLGAVAFFVLCSYALARPASESLFLAAYTRHSLPHAWAALSLLVVITVAAYNRLAAAWPLLRLYSATLAASAATLLVLLAVGDAWGVPFIMYIWKDIYIVLLVELFWSVANLVSPLRTARWTYWFYCMMGSLGGVLGNLASRALAPRIGSRAVLELVVPALGVAALLLLPLRRRCGEQIERQRAAQQGGEAAPLVDGLGVVWRSQYLVPLLLMIAIVQVVLTLIDYQFNGAMERYYPHTDQRTAVIGGVYAAIDGGSVVLQLLTGPLLRWAGVGATLLTLPVIIGGTVLASILSPQVAVVVLSKITGKAIDYSLLRASKELLYLPLGYEEKTQGKAIIDVLGYRLAKGGASLLLLGGAGMGLVPLVTLALCGGWAGLLLLILPRYRRHTG